MNSLVLEPSPLQDQLPEMSWTYIWLAGGLLVVMLAGFAFLYVALRRRWPAIMSLFRHPVFRMIDSALMRRFPRLWRFFRDRFSASQWRGLALTVSTGIVLSAVYVFAVVTESWADQEALYSVDRFVYEWLLEAMSPPAAAFMRAFTHLGDSLTIAVIGLATAAYLAHRGHRWLLLDVVFAVGAGWAFMWGLKIVFSRSRPDEQLASALGHSFPSGHAFMAAVLYGYLIYVTWKTVRSDLIRIGMTIVFVMIIILVGLSRIMLRVHWVSDVAGGFAAGLAWLVCSLIITQLIRLYRSPALKAGE